MGGGEKEDVKESASESLAPCSSCCHSPSAIPAWATLLALAAPLCEAKPQLLPLGEVQTQTWTAVTEECWQRA